MTRFSFAAILAVVFAGTAQAEGQVSCHTLASQAAAEWASGVLAPVASSSGERASDAILLISGGNMFSYRPAGGNDVRILQELGHKVRDYNVTWVAENDRCRGGERGIVILRY